MNLKDILKANGVEADKVDDIIDTINKDYIGENFVSKKQYSKRMAEITSLNEKIADIESNNGSSKASEWEGKYNTLKTEFDTYKGNIEAEKNNANKLQKVKDKLLSDGVNEKLVNLLVKEIDLNKVTVKEGNIEKWEEISKPLKDNYSDFYSKTTTEGKPPANPPQDNNPTKLYTKQEIEAMSQADINKNWDIVSKSLANLK